MAAHKALRPTPALAEREPRELDLPGRQISSVATAKILCRQESVRAEIIGEDRA